MPAPITTACLPIRVDAIATFRLRAPPPVEVPTPVEHSRLCEVCALSGLGDAADVCIRSTDVSVWPFGDMTKYANEGRFQPGSGHSCAGPSRARLWVHCLALLWQIHLGRGNVSIHVRQCGHRRGGDRMKSEMMACRTAGKLG